MITTYTTANPFGNGTTRVSSRVLRFFLGIKTYRVSLFRVFFPFLNFENFRSFFHRFEASRSRARECPHKRATFKKRNNKDDP